jgi:hypothetical protein
MTLDLSDLTGDSEEKAKPTTSAATETSTAVATEEAPATEEATETTESAEETVAETTTELVTEESETIGEAEVITEEASEEVEETAEETTEEVDTTPSVSTVSLFDYLNTHKDKIENATPVKLPFKNVPEGKYTLFVTNEDKNASIYKVDTPNKLYFENVEPTKILVENSGIIIEAENRRIYAGKTNVVQFDLVDDSPVKQTTFKKSNPGVTPKFDTVERVEADMEVDEIKLHIKKVSPKLDVAVKELTTKAEIKEASLKFLKEIRDLNHLIKIDAQIMMKCNL